MKREILRYLDPASLFRAWLRLFFARSKLESIERALSQASVAAPYLSNSILAAQILLWASAYPCLRRSAFIDASMITKYGVFSPQKKARKTVPDPNSVLWSLQIFQNGFRQVRMSVSDRLLRRSFSSCLTLRSLVPVSRFLLRSFFLIDGLLPGWRTI